MNQTLILYPVAAMMLLVAIVTVMMLRERIAEMKTRRIHPQKMSSSSQMAGLLENTHAADNYKNLFEMPVMFYVLCLALLLTQEVSALFVATAWAYVALRYLHSFIHITYNKVMHRFQAFAVSGLLLALMWLAFVVQLLTRA